MNQQSYRVVWWERQGNQRHPRSKLFHWSIAQGASTYGARFDAQAFAAQLRARDIAACVELAE